MNNRLMKIVRNYEVKTRLGANGRLSEHEIRGRVSRFGIAAAHEDYVLNQVRQVLFGHGVSTITFAYYHAFSRELGKLTRMELSPDSRECEYAIKLAKWVARGLLQPVLLDIGKNVFNLQMPSPPEVAVGDKAGEEGLTKST
jgi:hypothetical protein